MYISYMGNRLSKYFTSLDRGLRIRRQHEAWPLSRPCAVVVALRRRHCCTNPFLAPSSHDDAQVSRRLLFLHSSALEMAWVSIIATTMIALWVLSLFRILLKPDCVPSRPKFLAVGPGGLKKRNVLLVVAHPDDESMFFAPTLLYLNSMGYNLHILCISIGNADGKGNIRKEEFYQACAALKVSLQHIRILDHPRLQDGFDKQWDHKLLASIIEEEIKMMAIDVIITFDNYGISGHCNHRDVHYGICTLLCAHLEREIEAWELVSTSILRKYSGPIDIWLSTLFLLWSPQGQTYCFLNNRPKESYLAMAQHSSQWLWYRKLFVLFSSYTYMNTIRRIGSSR